MGASQYEVKVVHPAVGQWLTENGYEWQHEVRIPVGRIDFLCTHIDGRKLIVECKVDSEDTRGALRQLLDYQLNLGQDHSCALAMPSWAVTDRVRKACATRKVILILVDLPERNADNRGEADPFFQRRMEAFVFIESLFCQAQRKVAEIQRFHQERGTDALKDLFRGEWYARQYLEYRNKGLSQKGMITSDDLDQSYGVAVSAILDLPYNSLKDLVDRGNDASWAREHKYKELASPYLNTYGTVPSAHEIEFRWLAEKDAEHFAMANMIDVFEANEDYTIYYADDGTAISSSLIWEGSAHSFTNAIDWHTWRKQNRPSYFDQFDFLRPDSRELGELS